MISYILGMAATLAGVVLIMMMLLRGADPTWRKFRLSIGSNAFGLLIVGRFIIDNHDWAQILFALGGGGMMVLAAVSELKDNPRTTL